MKNNEITDCANGTTTTGFYDIRVLGKIKLGHDVAHLSGQSIIDALKEKGYRVLIGYCPVTDKIFYNVGK